jgi:hypothetical protein
LVRRRGFYFEDTPEWLAPRSTTSDPFELSPRLTRFLSKAIL